MRFYSNSEIKRILAAFDQAKMLVTQFCREKGISQASFYRWKNQQIPRPPAKKPSPVDFFEIKPPGAPKPEVS
jgi:transposase-like protein